MKTVRLFQELGEVDNQFIEEAYIEKNSAVLPVKWLAAAAGIVLAAAAAVGIFSGRQADIIVKPHEATSQTTVPAIVPEITVTTVGSGETIVPPITENTEQPQSCDFEFVTFFEEPAMTGEPLSNESMRNFLRLYRDKVNFVRFEITGRYFADEAAELLEERGFTPDKGVLFYPDSQTLFSARIEYDYLNDSEENREIYMLMAGTDKIQRENEPLYRVGDKYAAMFMDLNYNSVNTPLPELKFACIEKDGDSFLYKLDFVYSDEIRFYAEDGTELGAGLSDSERYRYTSAGNNPEIFTRKFTESEIAAFILADRQEIGYDIRGLDDDVFYGSIHEYTADGNVVPVDTVDDDVLPVYSDVDDALPVDAPYEIANDAAEIYSSDAEQKPGGNYDPIPTLMIPNYNKSGIYDDIFICEDLYNAFMPVEEEYFEPYQVMDSYGYTVTVAPPIKASVKTYAELMSDDERNTEISSLYRITVTRVLSDSEARQLAGWSEEYYDQNCTFYEGIIEYDYLRKAEMNESVIFRMHGTIGKQCREQPPYAQGDTIALVLLDKEEGSAISRPFNCHAFVYDVVKYHGSDYFAEREQLIPEIDGEFESVPISMFYITTTTDNSVRYYGFFRADDICGKLRALCRGAGII